MERESKTISTPGGVELKIKTYLTARERNTLRDAMLKHAKIGMGEDGETNMRNMEMSGTMLTESQNELIKVAVLSYGTVTAPDAILETLLNQRASEYDFVVEEASKINENFQKTK